MGSEVPSEDEYGVYPVYETPSVRRKAIVNAMLSWEYAENRKAINRER
jgi:hypothetical protein